MENTFNELKDGDKFYFLDDPTRDVYTKVSDELAYSRDEDRNIRAAAHEKVLKLGVQ